MSSESESESESVSESEFESEKNFCGSESEKNVFGSTTLPEERQEVMRPATKSF
jgi:hypothetical protein